MTLDSERNLTYKDMNTYAVCCISTAYDVKDAEAHAYLANFEQNILEAMNHPSDLMSKKYGSVASQTDYNALSNSLEDMTIPSIEELNYEVMEKRELKAFFKKLRTS